MVRFCCDVRPGAAILAACAVFGVVVLWFAVPGIMAGVRFSIASQGLQDLESDKFGHFGTFNDFGWMLFEGFQFHKMFVEVQGLFVFAYIVVGIVISIGFLSIWSVYKASPTDAVKLVVAYSACHLLTLLINFVTMMPSPPGLVDHFNHSFYYLFGLTVPDTEPFFVARVCWLGVLGIYWWRHGTKRHKTLVFCLAAGLTCFVVSTHLMYTAALVGTWAISWMLMHAVDNQDIWRTPAHERDRILKRGQSTEMVEPSFTLDDDEEAGHPRAITRAHAEELQSDVSEDDDEEELQEM